MTTMIEDILSKIKHLSHATVKIELSGKNIFVDPWKIPLGIEKADIILVTHPHYDHYSEDDIQKIVKDTTIILSTKEVIEQTSVKNKKILLPNEEVKIDDIIIRGFPAYNINKPFHKKENNWLGFIIKYKEVSIYVAGDTDVIDEMKRLKVDIAILPVGGTYTMTDKEAAQLVNLIKPAYAIPIHFGDIVGSKTNAENFKKLVSLPTKVVILK